MPQVTFQIGQFVRVLHTAGPYAQRVGKIASVRDRPPLVVQLSDGFEVGFGADELELVKLTSQSLAYCRALDWLTALGCDRLAEDLRQQYCAGKSHFDMREQALDHIRAFSPPAWLFSRVRTEHLLMAEDSSDFDTVVRSIQAYRCRPTEEQLHASLRRVARGRTDPSQPLGMTPKAAKDSSAVADKPKDKPKVVVPATLNQRYRLVQLTCARLRELKPVRFSVVAQRELIAFARKLADLLSAWADSRCDSEETQREAGRQLQTSALWFLGALLVAEPTVETEEKVVRYLISTVEGWK